MTFHIVHADEGVIVARAHERELLSIGRPLRIALAAPLLDERSAARVHRRRCTARRARAIQLTVLREHDVLAVGRELGSAATTAAGARRAGDVGESPRAASVGVRGPHRTVAAVRIVRRIRHPAHAICPAPRMNVTIDPSSDSRTDPTSTPSSSLNFVIFVALKSGADATYTLRMPRSYATHAILSAFLAALTSSGDDGDGTPRWNSRPWERPATLWLTRAAEIAARLAGAVWRGEWQRDAGECGEREWNAVRGHEAEPQRGSMPNQQIGAPDFAARPPLTPVSRRLFNAAADDRRTAGRLARLPDRIRHVRLPAGRPGRALPGGRGRACARALVPAGCADRRRALERASSASQSSAAFNRSRVARTISALCCAPCCRIGRIESPCAAVCGAMTSSRCATKPGGRCKLPIRSRRPRTSVASAKRPSENPTISVTASSAIDFTPGVIMACPPLHPTFRTTMTPSRRSPA